MTDTCPNCLARRIPPAKEARRGAYVVHGYICRCGHRWATVRLITAYPAVHNARYTEAGRPAA